MANATINEMQGQLNTVTAKLNEMTAAQQAAAEQAKAAHTNGTGAKTASGKKGAAESKRLKELQARIDERSEEHTSELQSPDHLVCRLLLEKKKTKEASLTYSISTNDA